eukprot:668747-Hanusia_phi.AAC.1
MEGRTLQPDLLLGSFLLNAQGLHAERWKPQICCSETMKIIVQSRHELLDIRMYVMVGRS